MDLTSESHQRPSPHTEIWGSQPSYLSCGITSKFNFLVTCMTYYIFLEVVCTQELQLNCLVEYTLDCIQELHKTLTWWTLDLLTSSGVNASVYKSYSSSSSATSFQISQRTTDMQACRLVIVHTAEDVDTEKPVLIFTLAPLHYCVSVSTSIQPFRGILGCFTNAVMCISAWPQ